MSLDAAFETTLGDLRLDVALSLDAREVGVLLGPNGAGKTTLLRALAGLVPLTKGRVVLDGDVFEDHSLGRRVPTESRPIGFVFQDYLLFPNMSALDNVAFGLRARGLGRVEATERARRWLERMGLDGDAHARPRALSGGQQQRVALARALAVEPRLLLLDEPLAALDVSARGEIRRELQRHLDDFEGTKLLVTHDPLEAMALATRIFVIEDGRISQSGTPEEIRQRPRSDYAADVAGLNLFRGRAAGNTVRVRSGAGLIVAQDHRGDVFAVVHPHAVALHGTRPTGGTPRNVWQGTVDAVETLGARARVHVAGPVPVVAEVTPAAVDELELAPGRSVWASVKATEFEVYPA